MPCDRFLKSLENRSPLPTFWIDLPSVPDIAREHFLHLLAESYAQHDRVDFIVARDAPPIEIRRTNRGPDPVDSCGLGMQHLALPEINFYPRVQEIGKVGSRRRSDQRLVGFSRKQQPNVHAAAACGF